MASGGRLLGAGAWAIACIWPIWTATAQPVAVNGCYMECPSFGTKRIPLGLLQSYKYNTCRWEVSVIFVTIKNRTICARPGDDWVQQAMRALDARKAATSIPKEPSAFYKLTGAATSTLAQAVGRTRPPGTAASAGTSPSAGPRAVESSTPPTSGLEPLDTGATLRPRASANGDAGPNVTVGPERDLGKPSPPMTSPAAQASSTARGRLGSEQLTGSPGWPILLPSRPPPSRPGKDPMEEDVAFSVSSLQPLTASSMENSAPSDSSLGPRSQTPLDLTSTGQRKDFAGQLGTRPDADGSRGTSMSTKSRNDATRPPPDAFREDSASPLPAVVTRDLPPTIPPTLGFHQENTKEGSRGSEFGKTPEVTFIAPNILDKYQTQVISVLGGGVITILFAGIAWAYLKNHISARSTPMHTVQDIVYSPVDTYANDFAMQDL